MLRFLLVVAALVMVGETRGSWAYAIELPQIMKDLDFTVRVTAAVEKQPPKIVLTWQPARSILPSAPVTIYRKRPDLSQWGAPLSRLPASATSFTDTDVVLGTLYEYGVVQGESTGFISSGIEIPEAERRGVLVLIVNKESAAALSVELKRLRTDLVGDGWQVITHEVESTDSPADVHKLIKSDYDADPVNVKASLLFGKIPIVRSGWFQPDGHEARTFAADCYYGSMSGTWTDSKLNEKRGPDARSHNTPGDGNLDQSTIPNDLELQIGRVDLGNMPAFEMDEKQLLRQYLNKNHDFRNAIFSADRRACFADGFKAFMVGPTWRSLIPCFGNDSISYNTSLFPEVSKNSYLCAWALGFGSFNSVSAGAKTDDFVKNSSKAVFVFAWGSYFCEWDQSNALLRAPLCAHGYGLASAWLGGQIGSLHSLAMGNTIGESIRASQNNSAVTGPYWSFGANNTVSDGLMRVKGLHGDTFPLPLPMGAKTTAESWTQSRGVHLALMGDPTLRLHVVPPPQDATAVVLEQRAHLVWKPSADLKVLAYHIYRADTIDGPFTRLNALPVRKAEFDCEPAKVFMIRAIKLEQTPSGSYYNLSQGTFASVVELQGMHR